MSLAEPVRLLVISGSMGAGKTTVLGEASNMLATAGIPHAAIDTDAMLDHVPGTHGDELRYRNLAAVWANYLPLGVTRLMLCTAVTSLDYYQALQRAVHAEETIVARLRADLPTMRERVRSREPVSNQRELVENVDRVEATLDAHGIEDFTICNDGATPIPTLTRELLTNAHWLT